MTFTMKADYTVKQPELTEDRQTLQVWKARSNQPSNDLLVSLAILVRLLQV